MIYCRKHPKFTPFFLACLLSLSLYLSIYLCISSSISAFLLRFKIPWSLNPSRHLIPKNQHTLSEIWYLLTLRSKSEAVHIDTCLTERANLSHWRVRFIFKYLQSKFDKDMQRSIEVLFQSKQKKSFINYWTQTDLWHTHSLSKGNFISLHDGTITFVCTWPPDCI